MSPGDLEIVLEPGQPTILTRRTFMAPRALVFEAWTNPEHVPRWWGPRALTFVSCAIDLRVGGGWRYVLRAPDGQEVGFRGDYHEIVRPERLVGTFVYEPMPGFPATETITFEEQDGRTVVTTLLTHRTVEARDGHAAAGMEPGLRETYTRLDEFLAAAHSSTPGG